MHFSHVNPVKSPWLLLFALLAFSAKPASGLPSRQPSSNELTPQARISAWSWQTREEEAALLASGSFTPRSDMPFLQLYGTQIRLNARVTVQILLDAFELSGIVHYGTAGSANDSLTVGSVSVPKLFTFTGSWNWTKTPHERQVQASELEFGAFNVPLEGKNLLGKLVFGTEEFFTSNGHGTEKVFWLELNGSWFKLAEQLQDLVIEKCIIGTSCESEDPKVVTGLKASTADTFVDNPSYRESLFRTFEVATVDEESAVIVMLSITRLHDQVQELQRSSLINGHVCRSPCHRL